MLNSKILIVGNRDIISITQIDRVISDFFTSVEVHDPANIFMKIKINDFDMVITCSNHKTSDGVLKVAKEVRRYSLDIPIIVITEYSSEDLAIAAIKVKINDYFRLPFSKEAILESIHQHLSKDSFLKEKFIPEQKMKPQIDHQPMVSKSISMKEVKEHLAKIAKTDSPVLITGESGTGKELAAESIHQQSHRNTKTFVCLNCSALPENLVESELFGYSRGAFTGAISAKPGKFALAEGGSLFLDEIGDMSLYAQAKILRCIEKKEISPLGSTKVISLNIRIIAATNKDPEKLMEKRKFREDLYYRLNVARVHMPPLRERKDDISLLITHAIEKMNRRFQRKIRGLSDEAMAILFRYDWPGNVRELMNLIEAAFIYLPAHNVEYMDLPKQLKQRLDISEAVTQDERKLLVSTLLKTRWNKSRAAEKLKWSRTTLYRKISEYNVVENRSPER
ncbi:sigma-54 dependent transcriptional regulator [uncultured Desulfobacter sp.]|uniref:sigma-54 dependent transcriptional regulator n=1 Tax=uncultured Desulfobacter sp. TaxID=240139 RepID=UPI002AA610D5|nr:sigma-54 dependent transcriptional regulator [uncultured Desulfobacter sp.]